MARPGNGSRASLAIGVVVQAALLTGDTLATRLNLPGLANGDLYHRTLGWRALGERAGALARQAGARTIVGDARDDVASLSYYWRDQPEQVLSWPHTSEPDHQFDLTRALSEAAPLPILFVSHCASTRGLPRNLRTSSRSAASRPRPGQPRRVLISPSSSRAGAPRCGRSVDADPLRAAFHSS